jgi:hypothetical protein
MSTKRDLITARNLLAGKNCANCELAQLCKSKLKDAHNTCAKWKLLDSRTELLRNLKVTWSQQSADMLEHTMNNSAEDILIEAASQEMKNELDYEFIKGMLFPEKKKK